MISTASLSVQYSSVQIPAIREPRIAFGGHFFGFAFFAADLPGTLFCAAAPLANPPCSRRISEFGVSLAHERSRRSVIGHVLLHGHTRHGAADYVDSQVLPPRGSSFLSDAPCLPVNAQ